MTTDALSTKQNPGNVLAAFLPKKAQATTKTNTETAQTALSAEGINAIIRSMMESNTGLASLLGNQKMAGLYNSTTAQLLANDLAARVGETAAKASAPTTKTVNEVSKSPGTQVDPKLLLGLQIVSELLGGSGKGDKSSEGPGGNLGGTLKSIGDFFNPKKKEETVSFNPQDNYSGFGFTDQNIADFSLSSFNPDSSLSLGSGNSYAYSPFSLTSGDLGSYLIGDGYNDSGVNTASAASYSPSAGFNFGNTGFGSSGINFGLSF